MPSVPPLRRKDHAFYHLYHWKRPPSSSCGCPPGLGAESAPWRCASGDRKCGARARDSSYHPTAGLGWSAGSAPPRPFLHDVGEHARTNQIAIRLHRRRFSIVNANSLVKDLSRVLGPLTEGAAHVLLAAPGTVTAARWERCCCGCGGRRREPPSALRSAVGGRPPPLPCFAAIEDDVFGAHIERSDHSVNSRRTDVSLHTPQRQKALSLSPLLCEAVNTSAVRRRLDARNEGVHSRPSINKDDNKVVHGAVH